MFCPLGRARKSYARLRNTQPRQPRQCGRFSEWRAHLRQPYVLFPDTEIRVFIDSGAESTTIPLQLAETLLRAQRLQSLPGPWLPSAHTLEPDLEGEGYQTIDTSGPPSLVTVTPLEVTPRLHYAEEGPETSFAG